MEYQHIDFGKTVIDGRDRGPDYDQIFPEEPVGKTIIDVGCNLGYYSLKAGISGAKWVLGIDNHDAFIKKAIELRNELKLDNVIFKHMSFEEIDDSKIYADIVMLLNVMHHLPTPQKVENWIQKAARMAREKIVFEVLHTDKPIEIIKNRIGNPKIHMNMSFIRRTLPDFESFIEMPSKVTEGRNIIIAWKN